MNKNKPIILLDPYPRTMDILFSKVNLKSQRVTEECEGNLGTVGNRTVSAMA